MYLRILVWGLWLNLWETCNRLADHFKKYGLLRDLYYSFKSSLSTADLLAVVSDRITKVFNRSGATWAVALEMSKVFDSVRHASILHKLKSYQGSGEVFGLTFSFLRNAQLRVVLDRTSLQKDLGANVPQTPILGPTLFPTIYYLWYCYLCWWYYSVL